MKRTFLWVPQHSPPPDCRWRRPHARRYGSGAQIAKDPSELAAALLAADKILDY